MVYGMEIEQKTFLRAAVIFVNNIYDYLCGCFKSC